MDGAKNVTLNENALTPTSKDFLRDFLNWKPEWKKYCSMDEAPYGFDLRIVVPSPTGNCDLDIGVWFANDAEDISICFGNWHCHGAVTIEVSVGHFEEWSILEAMQRIVAGSLACFVEAPLFDKLMGPLFLSSDFQIEDALTSENSGVIRVRSFDGSTDREISLKDLIR